VVHNFEVHAPLPEAVGEGKRKSLIPRIDKNPQIIQKTANKFPGVFYFSLHKPSNKLKLWAQSDTIEINYGIGGRIYEKESPESITQPRAVTVPGIGHAGRHDADKRICHGRSF
jgi:hypothetical protein